MPAMKIQEKMR